MHEGVVAYWYFCASLHGTQRLHHFHLVSARRPGPVRGANSRVFVHLLCGVIVSDVRGAGSFWVKRCLRDFVCGAAVRCVEFLEGSVWGAE